MKRRLGIFLCAVAVVIPSASIPAPDERGWLGIYTEPVDSLPEVEEGAGGSAALRGAVSGLRVTAVFPDSPADEGGLLAGDIIIAVCGDPFTCPGDSVAAVFKRRLDPKPVGTPCPMRVVRDAVTRDVRVGGEAVSPESRDLFWRNPEAFVDSLARGAVLETTVEKRQVVLDLPVVLGLRPEARWPEPPPNDDIYASERFPESTFTPLVWDLADGYEVRGDTEDLLSRLSRCHSSRDPYRLDCMMYVHRAPFRLESVSRTLMGIYETATRASDLVLASAELLTPEMLLAAPGTASVTWSLDEAGDPAERVERLMSRIAQVFADASEWRARAFADLTDEEKDFVERERWNLSDAFEGEVYIHFDEDEPRFRKNKRLIDIAARVDYGALMQSAVLLSQLTDPAWVRRAEELLREAYADSLDKEILLQRESPEGSFLIGGTSDHWYRDLDVAFVLDLGGDDFYTGNCGGSHGRSVPLSVCIDVAGDDAYESTLKSCQGTGCLGVGALLDLAGNDDYIGIQWCQGTGYLGVGWLHDVDGDDIYRGRSFCQGVGLFGAGLLVDDAGNDRYEGDIHVQGVGLAKGIGAVVDHSGDDQYYAKGLYPTGYGDAGIFDAWSQGCGMGFRTLASGGLGMLLDGGGKDRMEAGNFSQGGGYYYGYGLLHAGGRDDDVYIGSRYNQGFCAHQAVGVFIEEGGDDSYTTRQGVAQGLAWDECVTLFMDEAGDDVYEGGGFFSQGASAHNSFCFFVDRGGSDTYIYTPGQARAGGNTYHGGTSFSLFIDEGGDRDAYTAETSADDSLRHVPGHGFFLDLAGPLEEAATRRSRANE